MGGLKPSFLDFKNYMDLHNTPPQLMHLIEKVYNNLEDVYSVGSITELQDAIDGIGDGAGTIFIESGVHVITVPIDIDGGGSLVIYGHGDNTVLEVVDGISAFNITDCASLTIKNLQIDATNYTGATSGIIVHETNDNIITIEDVSFVGGGAFGVGIELQSDNCIVEHCNISQLQDGIYLNNSNRNIIAQNIVSNNARYGINLDTVLYSNIGNNTCNSNLMGIYVLDCSNNSISNNICNLNTEHGIYIYGSSYNTLSGNTCENNDSNTGNDQAGMFITNNSDFNTISGNSLNNNNNAGAGDGFGLVISTVTCEENVVASNNANGNDNNWKDVGSRTVIKYYVQTGEELQDAIDSIGTGAGTVIINNGTLTLTATITILGGGDYIIEGEGVGSVIDCGGNRTAFNITNANSCVIRNLKIDADDHTANFTDSITVNEGSDNHVVIEHVSVVNPNGAKYGRGVHIMSDNCVVQNCTINKTYIGIQVDGIHNLVLNNNITATGNSGISVLGDDNEIIGNDCNNNDISAIKLLSCDRNIVSNNNCNYNGSAGQGIYLSASDENIIIGNQCSGNFARGIHLTQSSYNNIIGNNCNGNDYDQVNDGGGIWISTNSDYNIVSGNMLYDNVNIGAGTSFGINIFDNTCNENVIGTNSLQSNDTDYNDAGTGTIGNWSGWFDDGVNFRITVVNGVITTVANSTGGGHNP